MSNYLSKDFNTILQAIVDRIKDFLPDWETVDFENPDFGTAILEVLAFLTENLHYYIERKQLDSHILTAGDYFTLLNLVQPFGYKPESAKPSYAEVRFYLDVPAENDIKIPEGLEVTTADGSYVFEVAKDDQGNLPVIYAGQYNVTGIVKNWISREETFVSDGSSYQTFVLTYKDVIDGTVSVYVDEGSGEVLWNEVDNFFDSSSTDMHYLVRYNNDGKLVIYFGDGNRGKKPDKNASIRVTYKTGGGKSANGLGKDTLTKINGTVRDVLNNTVNLKVTNITPTTGGKDKQTASDIKNTFPQIFRTNRRIVTLSDHEVIAKKYWIVAKAKAVRTAEIGRIRLIVADSEGNALSKDQKQALYNYLTQFTFPYEKILIEDPNYLDVDIDVSIRVKSNYDAFSVKQNVENAIKSFFDIDNIDFGRDYKVKVLDIYNAIHDTEGVENGVITKMTNVVAPRYSNTLTQVTLSVERDLDSDIAVYYIQIIDGYGNYVVKKRIYGEVTVLEPNYIKDVTQVFKGNYFVGWKLYPAYYLTNSFEVIFNDINSIYVDSSNDLRDYTYKDNIYYLEKELGVGKVGEPFVDGSTKFIINVDKINIGDEFEFVVFPVISDIVPNYDELVRLKSLVVTIY